MLRIDHLCKNYGNFRAVSDLSLHIPQGDLFGFVGPNGAGKTTTIRMVCGLMPPDRGSISINGIDALARQKELKRQIGYVPDFFGVYDNLKVREYMDFYGSMYRMSSAEIARISDDLLELVNLADKKEVFVDTLSRGMKQRLCVARALIHNPALLVLDEPNSGLDPRARVEMKELLLNLQSMGKTIVISSHILSELSEMCNSIGIMDQGRLVASGPIDQITESVFGASQLVVSFDEGRETAVRIAREQAKASVDSVGEHELRLSHTMTKREIAAFIGTLIANEVVVTGFNRQEGNLETLFMRVTGREEANAAEGAKMP
ncbi:MAG: ABC transporter ATP-binding protein [Lachnospiraceae bacterium]|nr:ABC transporter ATP-binding protein [Lachnospiraceae bacterium]